MTVSLTARSKAERLVKENLAALDEAIAFLRKAEMVTTGDKLAHIRDFLARSEAYYRRVEETMRIAEERRNDPLKRADRMWLDVTGKRRK